MTIENSKGVNRDELSGVHARMNNKRGVEKKQCKCLVTIFRVWGVHYK